MPLYIDFEKSGSAKSVSELYWNSTASEMQQRDRLVSLTKAGRATGYKNSQAVIAAIVADTTQFPIELDDMTRGAIGVVAKQNPDVDESASLGWHEFTVEYASPSATLSGGELSFGTSTMSESAKIITGHEQMLRVGANSGADSIDHGVDINVTEDSIEGTSVQVSADQVVIQMVIDPDGSFDADDVEALANTVNTNAFMLRHARTGRTRTIEAYAAMMMYVSVADQSNASGDEMVNCTMLVKPNYPAESPVVHPSFTTDPTGDPPTGGNRITMHAHDVLWFRGKPGQSASSSPVKMQVTSAYVVRVCDEVSWNGVFGTVS